MQQSMQWAQLFTARRTADQQGKILNPDSLRTSYIRDYDRIVFSSAFRRLQNKTQVFPLPGPVFVHNRLTHSLEVASVGRSLGRMVGHKIAEKCELNDPLFQDFYRYELGTVIAAACLAHDIGNPPFGHSGEDAIRTYFNDLGSAEQQMLRSNLSENQLLDFKRFEGNSNAFRTLTHNFGEDTAGGYNLTLTTLAAIVKYPSTSAEGFNKANGLISCKKSGFFDSEKHLFAQIAEQFSIPNKIGYNRVYARHPFVYLTEAADDICYRIIDLEDAHRLGITSIETIQELFLPFFREESGYHNYKKIEQKFLSFKDPNQQVQYLRAVWIGLMTQKLSDLFIAYEKELLDGTLEKSLMDLLPEPYQSLVRSINQYSYKKVYQYKSVVEIELTGFHVIGHLLHEFVMAVLYPKRGKSAKVLQMLSGQFPISEQAGLYQNLQSVVDYISGMTDLFALDLYRKMTGIQIAELK